MPDTGAPWNIPYVEAADLVSDWPADSLALANAIDAGLDAAGNAGIGSNVVSYVYADVFSASLSAGASTDPSGFEVTITPSSATSKVLLLANLVGSATEPFALSFTILRDSTDLANPTSPGSRLPVLGSDRASDTFSPTTVSAVYLDSPATTSATTYSVRLLNSTGQTETLYLNRAEDDTNSSGRVRGVGVITAIEVAS